MAQFKTETETVAPFETVAHANTQVGGSRVLHTSEWSVRGPRVKVKGLGVTVMVRGKG